MCNAFSLNPRFQEYCASLCGHVCILPGRLPINATTLLQLAGCLAAWSPLRVAPFAFRFKSSRGKESQYRRLVLAQRFRCRCGWLGFGLGFDFGLSGGFPDIGFGFALDVTISGVASRSFVLFAVDLQLVVLKFLYTQVFGLTLLPRPFVFKYRRYH